ncbi:MAG: hypothetical protein FJY86_03365 [Candidatus Diapherotrites archaeon]|uniref:Uncharacterized protein n=1 Tax=Candidatus Iainarchaeum sp. TaxID=3101447 RepID=A0A8T4C701_9ARCH|nr:hypothetical protein [Candidatus Diapherotrites archaeon]
MLPVYVVLFQLGSIFSDFEIIMKIAGLLFIVSFVRQHIPDRPLLSNVVILGLSSFLLFDVWKIFGSALFLYLLVSFGVLHLLVDLSFLNAFQRRPSHEDMQREQARQRAEREREMEEAREQGYEVPRRGNEEEYGYDGYGEGEDESGHSHKFMQGAAKARQAHGGASHASSGKHGNLSNVSAQMIQRIMQQRGGGGHR